MAELMRKLQITFRPVLRFCLSRVGSSTLYFSDVRCFSISSTALSSQMYRPPEKYRKQKPVEVTEPEEDDSSDEAEIDKLLNRTLKLPCLGHQVFIIQPFIKWGSQKKRNTTPALQLLEANTLIKTLRQWRVVDEAIISLQCFNVKTVFGSGVLNNLKERIIKNSKITAVFISVNTLTFRQQMELEAVFSVPVFDRFSIIMNIFKEHAQSKEAKLQIQLAQLPYLLSVLRGFGKGMDEKLGVPENYLGGSGPKLLSDRREIFRKREAKLRKEILELRKQRNFFRARREKNEIPVVAVIGYTNAGKTSLIKALTGKKTLEPQDYLFATLDVTSHLGVLPSGLKAYFVDTLGFISDIPFYLIESFVTTLEDVAFAQVIIHVRDISHPDTVAQNDVVNGTLKEMNLPETTMNNLITVANKIDLVEEKDLAKYKELIGVSSTKMTGIDVLREEVEKKILQLTDKTQILIRVQSGGPEYNWLHKWSTIIKEIPDEKNNQYMIVETIISSTDLARFKHNFIKNFKR